MKAVIIMTDGEFNTAFEAEDGNSSQQSELCANMKNAGVTVFSFGFEAPASALDVLTNAQQSLPTSSGPQIARSCVMPSDALQTN